MAHPWQTVLGILLAGSLVTACSNASDSSSGDEPKSESPSTATQPPAPKDGEVGSATCALSAKRLRFVVRDWGRVYDSIGREDHHRYTGALAADLAGLADSAATCHGAESFARFRSDVSRIDARSRRPSPTYSLYDEAVAAGNEWLLDVGLGSNALTVG